jgi:hypothetical protein
MAAVAHVSPAADARADLRRLVLVRTGQGIAPLPRLASPATVYRRRRAVALLVVVTVVAGLVLALGGLLASFTGGPASTTADRPAAAGAVYVVQPGDTFWEIARQLHPGEDPRPLVARLVAAHGSASLRPGERLTLPAG